MIRHIKKFLIISTLSLLINGCGIATVGKTASKLGDVFGYGATGNVGVQAFQQNAPLIIILIILCIVVFFIAKHHTSKQTRKYKNSVSSTTKKEKQTNQNAFITHHP